MSDDSPSSVGSSSPLLSIPGAVEMAGLGVARAYGNSFVEQRDFLAGKSVVDLSHRGIIRVSGPERLSWLDSLLSQKLDVLAPGESTEALLLDPHGRVQYAMRILDDGDATWLLVDEGFAPALGSWLDRMRFMKQVEVEDVSSVYATLGFFIQVPQALCEFLVTANGCSIVWQDPWSAVAAGGWQYAEGASPAGLWQYGEFLIEREKLADVTQRIRVGEISVTGLDALEALRIAAWRPRLATENDELLLPHEVDWLRSAVHLNKGCYRGQETVAKVHNLGHPPRRLVFLSLDGVEGVLPEPGAQVFLGEKEVGHITASARHWEEGPVAFAMVKRNTPRDQKLEIVAEELRIPATQVVIVPPDAGREVEVPHLPRLGAVTREK